MRFHRVSPDRLWEVRSSMRHLPYSGVLGGCHSVFPRFAQNASGRIARDQEFFVGRNYESMQARIITADPPFYSGHPLIPLVVQPQSRPFEAFADSSAD